MAKCRYFPECQRSNEVGDLWIPCMGGEDGTRCERYEPMPDVEKLVALADELDENAELIICAARNARFTGCGPTMQEAKHDAGEWRHIALRIRDALAERGE